MKLNKLENSADLEEAFDTWNGLLFRYVYVRLRNKEAAQDIVQESFIKAWNGREGFDSGKSSLKTWLFVITSNTMRDHLRQGQRHPTESLDENLPDEDSLLEDLIRDEQVSFVFKKMNELSEKETWLLFLRYKEGLDLKEIAAILDMNYSATKVAMHRALGRLKEFCNQ